VASKGRACVILPDTASSPEWENTFRPDLTKGFEAAGYKVDIQNANGDINKFATYGDQELAGGCGVMFLVDLEGAGTQVQAKAKAQGVPVVALDRSLAGSDYYVSYDNFKIGQIQGQGILDGLKAVGKDPAKASVVYVEGDPTDPNAKVLHDGANQVMAAAGIKPAASTPGTWDALKAGAYFEQAYTRLHGNVDAVWVANDTDAAAVITILDKYGKKLPTSGQDSTDAGLQNLLLGKQSVDVNTSGDGEPIAAVKLGIEILQGKTPTTNSKLADGTPFLSVDPQILTASTVKLLIADGQTTVARICTTPELVVACTKYGVK
jgi:D-xylose transport system substrate-binding protein